MPRPRGSFNAPVVQQDMFSKPPADEKPERKWTEEQMAVFDDRQSGKGHTVVEARAGTGKTTTIVEAMTRSGRRGKKLLTAFNVTAQRDLQSKLEKVGVRGAEARTLNSLGNGACYSLLGSIDVDEDKGFMIAMDLVGNDKVRAAAVSKLARLGKVTLANSVEELDALVDRFDLDNPFPEDAELFGKSAWEAMQTAKTKLATIDYDDQLWLPWVFNLQPKGYDEVYVDEYQDLNPAQESLVAKTARKGSRVCAIGDPHQCIYAWRAADADSMRRARERLDARLMKLTVTFRCPRRVVEEARKIVPEFHAAPGAPEGVVDEVSNWDLRRRARPGDFVLSRANAPLVGLCILFAKEGRRARVAGRDIGARLQSIIKKSRAVDVSELLEWVEGWKKRETERLEKRGRSTALVTDTAACLFALCEGARSTREVERLIDDVFDDDPAKGDSIVLSTVHKAKGLERDRVWLLKGTFRGAVQAVGRADSPEPEHVFGRGEAWDGPNWQPKEPAQEELNILYVAITRAKRELYYVT